MPERHLETISTVRWMRLYTYDRCWRFLNTLHLQSINHKQHYSFSNYLQLSWSTSRFILQYKRLTALREDQYGVRMNDSSRLQPLFYFWPQKEICSLSKNNSPDRNGWQLRLSKWLVALMVSGALLKGDNRIKWKSQRLQHHCELR